MKPTPDQITSAIHKGTTKAFNLYERWTGEWLNTAPEYMLTTYIAEALGRVGGNHYVTLEFSTKRAVGESGGRGRGILPRKLRPEGRIDLLLWNGRGWPNGAIEVKCQNFGFSYLELDVARIESILKRNSSINFGGLCVYLDRGRTPSGGSAMKRLRAAIKGLDGGFADRMAHTWKTGAKVHGNEDEAWASYFAYTKS